MYFIGTDNQNTLYQRRIEQFVSNEISRWTYSKDSKLDDNKRIFMRNKGCYGAQRAISRIKILKSFKREIKLTADKFCRERYFIFNGNGDLIISVSIFSLSRNYLHRLREVAMETPLSQWEDILCVGAQEIILLTVLISPTREGYNKSISKFPVRWNFF